MAPLTVTLLEITAALVRQFPFRPHQNDQPYALTAARMRSMGERQVT